MKNSFILNFILSFALGVLVTVSAYFLYLNIQKNRLGFGEQKEVAVQVLSFDELSKEEQDRYIKKDDLGAYGDFIASRGHKKVSDINSDNEPLPEGIEELKGQILSLRAQNRLLYSDNVDLASKNLELANQLSSNKTSPQQGQNLIQANELSRQLAEAQNENLQNAKLAAHKITSLQNEIDALKDELQRQQNLLTDDKSKELQLQNELKQTQDELVKFKDENAKQAAQILAIQGENQAKIDSLAAQNELQKSDFQKELSQKQGELEALKKEQNLASNTAAENIRRLELKLEQSDAINLKNKELEALAAEQNATIDTLNSKLQNQAEEFKNELAKIATDSDSKAAGLQAMLDESAAKYQALKDETEAKIAELGDLNLKKDEMINLAQADLASLKTQLEEKSKMLENAVAANNKDTKNYKMLNDKITSLVQINIATNTEAQKQITQAKNEMQNYKKIADESAQIIAQKDEQIRSLNEKFDTMMSGNASELEAKKDENLKLVKENKELKNFAQTGKNNATKNDEIATLKRQLSDMMNDSEYLSNENENLKKIIQLNFKSEVPKKVVFIASIECSDMSVGADKPTSLCKHRVSEFLQRYNSNYYFEITPMVSQGNFIVTSKVAKLIPKDELERFDSYANYGIARERAKIAGDLIKDEFGDFSRISYSNDIITSNKQGFVIKVYR